MGEVGGAILLLGKPYHLVMCDQVGFTLSTSGSCDLSDLEGKAHGNHLCYPVD